MALLTLIVAHALVVRLRFVPALRRMVDPPARVLIRDGKVDERNLRQHGHDSPADVHLALFEEKGAVSVLKGVGTKD